MPGYISEYDHYGNSPEFIELAIPKGTDVSTYQVVIYGPDGYVDHTLNLSDLTVQGTMGGHDVYVIESGTPGFSGIDPGDSTALIDDTGTVLQFVTHSSATVANDGPASGETSTYIGTASGAGNSLQSDDGGATYYVQSSTNPGTIPCYASGTLIDTPNGPHPVETLQPGDLVLTLDHGPQEILWTRSGDEALEGVEKDAKPVLISAGAFGQGLPPRDLTVSPQHRILVGGQGQVENLFTSEGLAPAKSLTGLPGIRQMQGKNAITWNHFACARHEVVLANGCATESLLLGPMVIHRLKEPEKQHLATLFGTYMPASGGLNGLPARELLKVGEVRRLLKLGMQEKGQRTATDIRKWDRDLAIEQLEAERLHKAKSMNQTRNEARGAA